MPEQIKPSGTDWETAADLTDWENHTIGMAQSLIWEDFGDGDSIEDDALDGKTIRAAYMGAGPVGEITPNPTDNYVPEHVGENTQVTAWRLRYPDLKSIEIAPTKEAAEKGNTLKAEGESVGELFRGRLFVRPGVPCNIFLACAAIWTKGFQVGKRRMDHKTRAGLYRELHELLNHALENMPSLEGTYSTDGDDSVSVDLEDSIRERLKRARGELKGDTYHVDLPHFTVEVEEDDEDDAPAPRPSPSPFDLATGVATFPTDPTTRGNLKGISAEGDWIEDSFGRPVYRYTIEGPPWGGNAQLSVKEAIEAETAWKMLRDGKGEDRPAQFHADAVALYLLFLAYAGDQAPENRPGENGEFRIRGKDAFRILNLPAGWDLQKKVRHVYNLNSYLNSFQIQLKRVTYEGQRKQTDAISPAQLWDTYLRGVQEEDLHGNVTNIEFWIEGREGAWADLFVHDSDKWTPWGGLPIRMLEEMDGRNRFNRLILFRVWVLFRVEKGTVKRTGDDLLKWCRVVPDELTRQTVSRRRSTILNALEEIKQKGFHIDDSRLRAAQGAPLEDWQAQPVYFYPPPEIVDACPQVQAPKGELPEPRSEVWTGKRVRALRKHIGETQGEFGKRLPNREGGMGVKQPRVSTIEQGNHSLTERQEGKLDEMADDFGFKG